MKSCLACLSSLCTSPHLFHYNCRDTGPSDSLQDSCCICSHCHESDRMSRSDTDLCCMTDWSSCDTCRLCGRSFRCIAMSNHLYSQSPDPYRTHSKAYWSTISMILHSFLRSSDGIDPSSSWQRSCYTCTRSHLYDCMIPYGTCLCHMSDWSSCGTYHHCKKR